MNLDRVGKRLSVAITLVVGILSVVTGIANIGYAPVVGPLAPFIPGEVSTAAGFTGALTGFVMMLGAFGLRRGLRAGWYVSFVLLPVTAVQGVIQSSPYSIPLVVLSIIAFPTLLTNRSRFQQPIRLSTSQVAAGVALIGVQLYGTVGTYTLRSEFSQVNTVLDAFYFTIVTASTVGYGDVTGQSQIARLFSMSVLVFGTASFAAALGALLAPAIEARFSAALGKMKGPQFEIFEDHVVILGFGELTEPILSKVTDRSECIVVTRKDERAEHLHDRGVNVLNADPTNDEALRQAQIEDAKVAIAATDDDADDAFATITARQLRPDLRIIAAATNIENISNLRNAGADAVVSPPDIAGMLMVRSALQREFGDLSEATG